MPLDYKSKDGHHSSLLPGRCQPILTSSPDIPTARVLLAEESLPYRRVIREALMSFRHCEVDDCQTGERAFELAMSRRYHLIILALPLPDLGGLLLDRLIAHAYPLVHQGSHTAPPVIFISRSGDASELQALKRDVRLRGCLGYPPKLDALLALTSGLLPEKRPDLPPLPTKSAAIPQQLVLPHVP
jgi:CheY-like chemotaxis protein